MQHIDVSIVGGGLAGWAAAASAAGAGATVTVIDRDGVGGRAATDEVEGFSFNRGAHALYRAGPGTAVLRHLGIDPAGAEPPVRGARGVLGEQLDLLPIDPVSIARTRLLGARSKARFAGVMAGFSRRDAASVAHLTIDDFLDDLDLRDDARRVLAAIIRLSSYVADHSRVSADVAVTQLQLATKGVRYLHGGWHQLVDGLRGVAARHGAGTLATAATSVHPDSTGVDIVTSTGIVRADRVVLAAGGPGAAASLLGRTPPGWRTLGPAGGAACLDVGLDTDRTPPLTIGIDEPLYFNSHGAVALAPPGRAVVHVMRYLRHDEDWSHRDGRSRLEAHLLAAGVDPSSVVHARYLHRMTVTSALPVPEAGGMAGRPTVTSSGEDRVLVAGDWVGPSGNLVDAPLVSGAEAGRVAARRAARALAP
jgi:phytoene dehydrogenase-like protein